MPPLPIRPPEPPTGSFVPHRPLPGLALRGAFADGRALWAAVVAVLLGCTVLQRLGLTVGGASLHAAWLAMMALLAIGLASGRLLLDRTRAIVFAVLAAVGGASLAVNATLAPVDGTSALSWLLLLTMYLPFACVLRPDPAAGLDATRVLKLLADVAAVCAVVGIVQFAAQSVVDARWLFDPSPLLPAWLRSSDGYNVVIPVGERFKSNGFFFKEPSLFSLVLAFGLLCELALWRRRLRLAVLVLATMLTYSGSGLLVLAVALLFPLRLRTLLRLAGVAAVGAVAVFALWDLLGLGFTLGRVAEFTDPRSSAYARYVAPARLVIDSLGDQPWAPWLGHGPGSITRLGDTTFYAAHDPTWAKALFEYGLLGFAAVTTLAVLSLRHAGVPIQLRVAAFVAWFATGGFLLTPEALMTIPLLSGLWLLSAPAGSTPDTTTSAPPA